MTKPTRRRMLLLIGLPGDSGGAVTMVLLESRFRQQVVQGRRVRDGPVRDPRRHPVDEGFLGRDAARRRQRAVAGRCAVSCSPLLLLPSKRLSAVKRSRIGCDHRARFDSVHSMVQGSFIGGQFENDEIKMTRSTTSSRSRACPIRSPATGVLFVGSQLLAPEQCARTVLGDQGQ
jgi:hypothetical protein